MSTPMLLFVGFVVVGLVVYAGAFAAGYLWQSWKFRQMRRDLKRIDEAMTDNWDELYAALKSENGEKPR